MKLSSLFGEDIYQILRQDLRVPRDVEDVFLRVQRSELTTKLRQGVDDSGRGAPHARIKRGKETGGSPANDRDVCDLVRRHAFCQFIAHQGAKYMSVPISQAA